MLMRCILAGLLMIVFGAHARAEELQERAAIDSQVYELLQDEDLAALEAMADSYRKTEARTSSGLWKLTLFYVAVERSFESESHDWAVQRAKAWIDRYPRSPTAHLVYAGALSSLEKTGIYLDAHKDVAARDPRWYEMMAGVATGQGWPQARFIQMIDEGLKRTPSYYPIYFATVDSLDASGIERFARQAVERTKATDGWGIYARIYWYAAQTRFGDNLFTQSQVNWADMKRGMDDVLRHYADGWNLANFLKFACLKGDGPEMKVLTQRMNDVAWSVWDNQNYSATCKALSAN
jgi:hypothetical protein